MFFALTTWSIVRIFGILFALKSGHFQAIYRWLSRDFANLLGNLPESTRLQCWLKTHQGLVSHVIGTAQFLHRD
jgi:hypothetical protein